MKGASGGKGVSTETASWMMQNTGSHGDPRAPSTSVLTRWLITKEALLDHHRPQGPWRIGRSSQHLKSRMGRPHGSVQFDGETEPAGRRFITQASGFRGEVETWKDLAFSGLFREPPYHERYPRTRDNKMNCWVMRLVGIVILVAHRVAWTTVNAGSPFVRLLYSCTFVSTDWFSARYAATRSRLTRISTNTKGAIQRGWSVVGDEDSSDTDGHYTPPPNILSKPGTKALRRHTRSLPQQNTG